MRSPGWKLILILPMAILGGALLGFVGLCAWVTWELERYDLVESGGPVDLAEARRRLPFDYPDSAHHIRFASFSQFVAFEMLIRLEAPIEDCRAVAERVIAEHNARHPDRIVPDLAAIGQDAHDPPIDSAHFRTDWFDIAAIGNGLVGGKRGSHTPQVWVDLDRGVFYYLIND
jgi:hypothetical protein